MIKKIRAFTLAETLITLLVIGVVAALTIPSLMQSWKDRQYATAKNKAMSTIGNGFKLMIANNDGVTTGLPLLQCEDDFECLSGVFHKSFQIGTDKNKTHEGLAEKYTKNGDSTEEAGFVWDDVPYIFTTNDGMTYGYLGGFEIVVDVNGNKSPNKVCKDIYKFSFNGTTVKDKGNKDDNGTNVVYDICEDLDDGIKSNSYIAWFSTPCGNEKKECYGEDEVYQGEFYVYDSSGTAIALLRPGNLCAPYVDNDYMCIEAGYSIPEGTGAYFFKNED